VDALHSCTAATALKKKLHLPGRQSQGGASRLVKLSPLKKLIWLVFPGLRPLPLTIDAAITEKSVTNFVYSIEKAGFPEAGLYNRLYRGKERSTQVQVDEEICDRVQRFVRFVGSGCSPRF
jgi:hypothetical protein